MKKIIVFIIIVLCFVNFLNAQKRTYTTKRVTGSAPKIDGIFNDKTWENVEWQSSFTQFEPNNGEKPSQKTEFKILFDDNNIYVAIKALDTEAEKINKRMSRRDGWEGEFAGIQLDSYNDKRTGFIFVVSAAGIKNDAFISNDGDNLDMSWDPIWFVKTSIDDKGWYAEMKIPLSQLRFSKKDEQTWGLQIVRKIHRNDEFTLWQAFSDEEPGWVSKYGDLKGIKNIKPKKQIEFAPYIMSSYNRYETEEGNPFADGHDFNFNAGIDGKIGITNDLILDFAINPDFGQVEADPSEVNLSAFETFFEEKRPFFIEGKNITDFQITPGGSPWARDNLFYSRRIGRTPQVSPNVQSDEYLDVPSNSKILGAFKLTGKTKDGWSIGIIETVTSQEKVKISNNIDKRTEIIEPYTNYLIGRIQKDINKGNTIIGIMGTSTYRNISSNELLLSMNKTATTGGLDFTQYFKQKKYFISAKVISSHITGDKQAILEQQLSSRRYFQRPNAEYFSLDSNRTSLTGQGGNIALGKSANKGLTFTFNVAWRSPELELNDVGYLRSSNNILQFFYISYKINKPFSIFRQINFTANEWLGWDFDGNNTFTGGNISTWIQFKNLWSFSASVTREGLEKDNSALRGGSTLLVPGEWSYNLGFSTNSTKKISIHSGFFNDIKDSNAENTYGVYSGLNIRPINILSISLSANYTNFDYDLLYLHQSYYQEIDETRYIFATINQQTLSITARVDFSITPDLTIQLYTSPFVSSGLYSDYRRITNPTANNYTERFSIYEQSQLNIDTYEIDENIDGINDYSFDNPNFNYRQFHSNLVLRWEYTPGSSIFLVWSQSRTSSTDNGKFDYFNDIENLFSEFPNDVFLIKIQHRFRAENW